MIFSKDEMRQTILGKARWTRCLSCDATGWENWDENGSDVKSGTSSNPERCNGECENCEGLGFVKVYE